MELSKKQNFLIDGFPRNKDNLDGWNRVMNSVAVVRKVLFFNCPEEVRHSSMFKMNSRPDFSNDKFYTQTASTKPETE